MGNRLWISDVKQEGIQKGFFRKQNSKSEFDAYFVTGEFRGQRKRGNARLLMSRKKKNIFTALSLSAVLAIGIPCYAGTTQEQIDSANEDKAQTQTQLVSVQDRINALEAQKGNAEAYLAELNSQLTDISGQMTQLQTQYDQKLSEIAQIEQELEAAKETEKTQYEDMKLRIKYMYEESTNAGALESLFSAESFTDFLNRAENMSQINQYDRDMLSEYQDTVNEIKEKENQLVSEKQNIEVLKQEQEQQQEAVEALFENSYREYESYVQEIQSSESDKVSLVSQIQAQEDALNSLISQKYAEEAAEKEAAQQAAMAAQQEAAQQEATAAQQAETSEYTAQTEQSTQSTGNENMSGESVETDSAADTGISDSGNDADAISTTYLGNFKLTAYCSCAKCCGKWSAYAGLTASGAYAAEGVTVAMGGVPFGTQLMINGHTYTVQDRGTPYGHVDIYFSNHQAAVQFGLQYADVYQIN